MTIWGGIEAGGTKHICAIGTGPDHIVDQVRIPTTSPKETLHHVVQFFRERQRTWHVAAIGIASFGPIDTVPNSPTYGTITSTPKPGWAHTNLVEAIQTQLGLPVCLDTDVNGAALAENRWGAAQGLHTFVYLTIGTGVGGGGMVGGQLIRGLNHPEMGHVRIPHDWKADPFAGVCPYHGDCLEGLASGPAIEGRWGQPAHTLSPDHPAWNLEANYLALALANLICTILPQRIILGGGVMQQAPLFPLVRQRVQHLLNGYLPYPSLGPGMDHYIVPPALGNQAGVLGAIALAQSVSKA
jgi:fructokinase